MKVRVLSIQSVEIEEMFVFEFVGEGCYLPEDTKAAIFQDLLRSVAAHLKAPDTGKQMRLLDVGD